MQSGEHDWPEEFRDEDKWVFLTKRQWLIMLVGALIGVAIIALFFALHLTAVIGVGFVAGALCLIGAGVVAFFPMPDRFYLFGGGVRLEKLLFRLIKKNRKGSRLIWTANYDNGLDEWGAGAAKAREARRRARSEGKTTRREKLPWE